MEQIDLDKISNDFLGAVSMSVSELERWLGTEESRSVGWKGVDGSASESVGHMRKVVGFVSRHKAQRPENVYTSRWRYSLMNWGHDPTKEEMS